MLLLSMPLAPANAGFETGNDLLRQCQSTGAGEVSYCLAYVEGVQDAFDGWGVFCVPIGTEAQQLREIVTKELSEAVTTRQEIGSNHVVIALSKAWPCPKASPRKPSK